MVKTILDFQGKGKLEQKVPIQINYQIIDLFSGGLYSSPNKAFEELISNSYDANATHVSAFMSSDLNQEDSIIWICDNGDSMNKEELKQLWKIGESNKKILKNPKRKQIGMFGIGKLATYAIANELTYICKKEGEYRMIIMDYRKIPNEIVGFKEITLDEKVLSEKEAKEIIDSFLGDKKDDHLNFNLFGKSSSKNWTLALLSNLKKDKVKNIREGFLRWVLSTAIPLNPNFNLYFNGNKLESSKINEKIITTWIIGKDDDVAEKNGWITGKDKEGFYVDLPNLKKVRGKIELYENTLTGNKSDGLGRSYGIFLRINKRLINVHNPLLNGMDELHHATFNRIRILIDADNLSKDLTAARESLQETNSYKDLTSYINKKFNRATGHLTKYFEDEDKKENFSEAVLSTSPFYSKIPLANVTRKFFDNKISEPYLLELSNIPESEREDFYQEIEKSISNPEKKLIENNSYTNDLTSNDPLAKLDLKNKTLLINTSHPFYINFLQDLNCRTKLTFSLIAINEVLTEMNLIEKGVDQILVNDIMKKRDKTFREFAREDIKNNPFRIALNLKESLHDKKALEESLHDCFRYLGFDVKEMCGRGEPEGIAYADKLGKWKNNLDSYSFTYEAKSTDKEKIRGDTAKHLTSEIHKEENGCDYALIISIGYEGEEDETSRVNKYAEKTKVCTIKAQDFWNLILYSIPNGLTLKKFRELLEKSTVPETSEWIKNFINEHPDKIPYREILDAIWELKDKDEPASLKVIRHKKDWVEKYTLKDLEDYVKRLSQLLPNDILIEEDEVQLLNSPDKVLENLEHLIEQLAPLPIKQEMRDVFIKKINGN